MTIADAWAGARSPRWIVEHLDSRDQAIRRLPVMSGSVKVATFARLGGQAQVSIARHDAMPGGDRDINWYTDRISISYDPGHPDLPVIPWGVYIFASPRQVSGIVDRYDAELLTKVALIDQDQVAEAWSLPSGSPIIPAVVSLIESTGEMRIAATESSAVTSASIAFPAGTSKLTIINDLLTSADYTALWADGTGQFRVEPTISPRDRPIAYTFAEGPLSIHKPDWDREQDLMSIPNRVIVVSQGNQDEPPIVGVAENNDPDSPYSIPSRGRVIARTEEVTDMSSTSAANAHAQRLLDGGMSPVATLSVEHGIVPLDPGARVRFIDGGEQRDATVREMNMSLTFDSQCQALWREI